MVAATRYFDQIIEPIEEPLAFQRECSRCPATLKFTVQINERHHDLADGLEARALEVGTFSAALESIEVSNEQDSIL